MKYDIESIKRRNKNRKRITKIIDVFLVILIYNVILVMFSCMNKIEQVNIFGYEAYIVTTDSMKPSISSGDVVIVKEVEEQELDKGDIITFTKNGETNTHRITNIEEKEGEKYYTTKGDNNNVEDSEKVKFSEIIGKQIITIPYLGKIINALENKVIFLVIVLIILILYFLRIKQIEKKENRREKKKIEEEKENID